MGTLKQLLTSVAAFFEISSTALVVLVTFSDKVGFDYFLDGHCPYLNSDRFIIPDEQREPGLAIHPDIPSPSLAAIQVAVAAAIATTTAVKVQAEPASDRSVA